LGKLVDETPVPRERGIGATMERAEAACTSLLVNRKISCIVGERAKGLVDSD
jgi:hypothetical protein